jgi:hypothetical protein
VPPFLAGLTRQAQPETDTDIGGHL